MALVRIGVDIGGTFTDFSGWRADDGRAYRFKVPSTPPRFAEGFRSGFERMLEFLKIGEGDHVVVMHGTTVSTNTVIERSADKIALLVTKGFGDILKLQRLRLRNPIDLFSTRAEALVPRNLVFEVEERLSPDGRELVAVNEDDVRAAVQAARSEGVSSVAVVMLHSYRDGSHETRVREIIADADPEMDVCLSSAIWPRIGEYERAVNATLNIYVKPRMKAYLDEIDAYLESRLASAQLFVTRSNGGALGLREAADFPIHTLLSGPASGVTAAQQIASSNSHESMLTLDMGGTSTDISLILKGQPTVASAGTVGDFPVTMPVTEIEAIGAGGGSLARLNGPALLVGPESAGAFPGPASFGRGGDNPTVTDAYLLCGYFNAENFLGGAMPLDKKLAERAFESLARDLDTSAEGAADACLSVTTSNMVSHVLPYLASHGVDIQNITLVAFGGNGPLHGPLLAEEIGVKMILIPPAPSVFCAYGGIVTALTHDVVSVVHGISVTGGVLDNAFADLRKEAGDWLSAQIELEHLVEVEYEYSAEMRYKGQSFQIPVPVAVPEAGHSISPDEMAARFHSEHQRLFAHSDADAPTEFVALHVRVRGHLAAPATPPLEAVESTTVAPVARRDLRISGSLHRNSPIYARNGFTAGATVKGPCIIEQEDATILVPPAYDAQSLSTGAIALTRRN